MVGDLNMDILFPCLLLFFFLFSLFVLFFCAAFVPRGDEGGGTGDSSRT